MIANIKMPSESTDSGCYGCRNNNIVRFNGKEIKVPKIIAAYANLCITGTGMGLVAGSICGSIVGFTVAASMPLLVGGVAYKLIRQSFKAPMLKNIKS